MNNIFFYLKIIRLYLTKKIVNREDIANSYDIVSNNYNDYFLTEMHKYNDIVIEKCCSELNDYDNLVILDLACGTGYNSLKISEFITNGKYILVDSSLEMIKNARCRTTTLSAEYHHIDMLAYLENAKDNSIDIVICNWAIKYQDIASIIKLSNLKLKEQGQFICIVNTKDTLKEVYPIFNRLLKRNYKEINKLMMYLPNPRDEFEFERWFSKHNFKTIYLEKNKQKFIFDNASEHVDFLTSTGALAGFDKMIDLNKKNIHDDMINQFVLSKNFTATHRFVMGVFKKEK